jgi:hypothetical protein
MMKALGDIQTVGRSQFGTRLWPQYASTLAK